MTFERLYVYCIVPSRYHNVIIIRWNSDNNNLVRINFKMRTISLITSMDLSLFSCESVKLFASFLKKNAKESQSYSVSRRIWTRKWVMIFILFYKFSTVVVEENNYCDFSSIRAIDVTSVPKTFCLNTTNIYEKMKGSGG